jgi:hypothetical protein
MTTTQSLSSVASNVVGQYSEVGKIIVGAYRSGAQRLVSGANTRYASFLNGRALPLVTEDVKASLIKVQTQIAGLFEGGINSGSDRAEQAIDFVAGGVNGGIQRVATTAERVEEAFDTKAITTVSSLAMMPVAQVSLVIANRAVEGTKRLSARVVGAEAEVVQVAATTKRVVKKAVRRVKARA